MCYSAMIQADYDKYVRKFGATMSLEEFAQNVWNAPNKKAKKKRTRAMEDWLVGTDLWPQIQAERAAKETAAQQDLFKQKKRQADAERTLLTKVTKKAQEDLRISTDKISKLKVDLDDLQRTDSKPRDARFFPGMYAPVIVMEDGKRVIKPMRYQCRLPGWNEAVERKYPGTYNARRDSLGKAWSELFGVRHGIIVVTTFYENVERHAMEHRELKPGEESENVVLEFKPRDEHDMYVACLWNESPDEGGNLLSFAAITDDPAPEVAAAGHDRTIIEVEYANWDDWLTAGLPPARYQEILSQRPKTYYEHQVTKAA